MLCESFAPIAQLAEQLTLNQWGTDETSGKSACSEGRAAQGAAINLSAGHSSPTIDRDLASVIVTWPRLSPSVRAEIMVIVRGHEDT